MVFFLCKAFPIFFQFKINFGKANGIILIGNSVEKSALKARNLIALFRVKSLDKYNVVYQKKNRTRIPAD